jgi:Ca2+/H+ antiporter, TMEM165/GDT1 family
MTSFFKAFGLVALAELGDKSQLLALAFAAKYRPLTVLAGITLVAFVLNLAWAAAGSWLGSALPERPVMIAAGALFIAFGLWTLRPETDEAAKVPSDRRGIPPIVTVTVAFFLSEVGDKTMLATLTLASTQGFLATWLGAALGMTAADAAAVALGYYARMRLPERPVRLASAALFIAFGVWSLVSGVVG